MVWLEILTGIFLLATTILPFQNYELAKILFYGMAGMAVVAFLLKTPKNRSLATLFFHFCVIFALCMRATMAEGWLYRWFLCAAWTQWGVVLWLTLWRDSRPSLFLIVTLISPIYQSVLNGFDKTIPGIAILCLLSLHAFYSPKSTSPSKLPWLLVGFLSIALIAIPFSLYPGRNLQFFLMSCCFALVYLAAEKSEKEPLLLGYLFHAVILFAFAWYQRSFLFQQLGTAAWNIRLAIVVLHNDLVPSLLIFSAMLLDFLVDSKQRWVRIVILSAFMALGALLFFTFSRNGWIAAALMGVAFRIFYHRKINRRRAILAISIISVLVAMVLVVIPSDIMRHRVSDTKSIGTRVATWIQGIQTIAAHPLFGIGWTNYYAHAKYPEVHQTAIRLDPFQNSLPPQTHSVVLDLCETAGIPLAISFFMFLFLHFKKPRLNAALCSGLVGVVFLCIFDSAPLWLHTYPHIWILLGRIRSRIGVESTGLPVPTAGLILILCLAGIAPLLVDHWLQKGNSLSVNNKYSAALRHFDWARILAPLDVAPLEAIEAVYLSEEKIHEALNVLQKCMSLKKEYSPYFARLGKIYFQENKYPDSERALREALRLDPHARLGGGAYQALASLASKQRKKESFEEYFSMSVLLYPYAVPIREIRSTLSLTNEDEMFRTALRFLDRHSTSMENWCTSLDYFRSVAEMTNKRELAIKILEVGIKRLEGIDEEYRDYFRDALAEHYAALNQWQKIKELKESASPQMKVLMQARLDIHEGRLDRAAVNLESSMKYYGYYDLRNIMAAYLTKANDVDLFKKHLRILEIVSSNHYWRIQTAGMYFARGMYKEAASEYDRVTFEQYSNIGAHWRAVRSLWLSGDSIKASEANERMLRLTEPDPFLESFYSVAPGTAELLRLGIPNRFGGNVSRVGVYAHPPLTINFPSKCSAVKGYFAMMPEVWDLPTNGVVYEIVDQKGMVLFSQLINPTENVEHQKWNSFEWKSKSGPVQIRLRVQDNGNPTYDWAFCSIESLQ